MSTSAGLRFAINGGEPVDCDGIRPVRRTRWRRFGFDAGALRTVLRAGRIHLRGHHPRCRAPDCGTTRSPRPSRFRRSGTRFSATPIPGMEIRICPTIDDTGRCRPRRRRDRDPRHLDDVRLSRRRRRWSRRPGSPPVIWATSPTTAWWSAAGPRRSSPSPAATSFPTEIERVAAQIRGVREGAVVAVGTGDDVDPPGSGHRRRIPRPRRGRRPQRVVPRVASECGVVPADVVFAGTGLTAAHLVGQAAPAGSQTQPGGGDAHDRMS